MATSSLETRIIYDLVHHSLCYSESNPYSRQRIANVFRKHLTCDVGRITEHLTDPAWEDRLGALRHDGLVRLGSLLTSVQIENIRQYFLKEPVYNRHHPYGGDKVKRPITETAQVYPYGSFDMQQVLEAPHLLEIALDDRLLEFAEVYLECLPTVYSIHVFLSFPGHAAQGPQSFHRDMESFSSCALMLFLSDVDAPSGPHRYILGSGDPICAEERADPQRLKHLPGGILDTFMTDPPDGYGHDHLYEDLFKDDIVTVQAAAGEGFMINPYGLHMGVPPKREPRLMCWIRYGVMPTTEGPPYNEPVGPAGLSLKEVSQRRPGLDYRSRFAARYILAEREEWDALAMSLEYPGVVTLENPESPNIRYVLEAGKITDKAFRST